MPQDHQRAELIVARYRPGRKLGAGAHGTVYLAEDLGRGGEQVALKLVRDSDGTQEWKSDAARFLRWFRHPNWADILDAGSVNDDTWFEATRYINGRSLDTLDGPQDPEFVWRFLEDGARVLGALHQRGVIHYDVTPGNFLLEETDDGPRFVLTDGGLAHLGPVNGYGRGTPLYMAPELATDTPHDHRVDLYSLGLVAYELTTGEAPWGHDVGTALAQRRRLPPPRCGDRAPGVPPALEDLVADLLALDPASRPQDGTTLLRAIADGQQITLPDLTRSEAYALADGGPLVGQARALSRFSPRMEHLSEVTEFVRSQGTSTTPIGSPEPLLLLTGEGGAGCTRLSREVVRTAREHNIAVLLVAGRDGAPDPGDPLQALEVALAALTQHVPPNSNAGSQARERKRARRAQRFVKQRRIEQFVARALTTARVTPFVLVAEDYGELPEVVQSALRALGRELQALVEHGPEKAAPPVLLVLDLGDSPPGPLLIADSANPRRPIIRVRALRTDQVGILCGSKFPSLTMAQEDLQRILVTTGALPRAVTALLSEAVKREDLLQSHGVWTWHTQELDSYEVNQGLTSTQEASLASADSETRVLLEALALADAGLRDDVLSSLWHDVSVEALPSTPLMATRRRGQGTIYALASRAVRERILEALRADPRKLTRTIHSLLHALDTDPQAASPLDHANLLLLARRSHECIRVLDSRWGEMTTEQKFLAQSLTRRALVEDPTTLESSSVRTQVATNLEGGADGLWCARALAKSLPECGEEAASAIRAAEALEDARDPHAALELLRAQASGGLTPHNVLARVQVRRAKLALNSGAVDEAQEASARATDLLGSAQARRHAGPGLTAEFLSLRARWETRDGRHERAIRILRLADRAARRARDLPLRGQLMNNLGVAYAQTRRVRAATRLFARSLRVKRALGDIRGAVFTSLNLARIHSRAGELLDATRLSIDCTRRAQRFGLDAVQLKALRHLAETYDRQHRPVLAMETLQRAWRLAGHASPQNDPESDETICLLGLDLAPIAASVGRLDLAEAVLARTADLARASRRNSRTRGRHHLVSALVHLHAGLDRKFELSLRRALRYHTTLPPEDRWTSLALAAVSMDSDRAWLPMDGARHHGSPTARYLFRVSVWARRLSRHTGCHASAPGFSRAGDAPSRGIPAGAHGRLSLEIVLAAALRHRSLIGDGVLAQLLRYARLSEATGLQARVHAARTIRAGPHKRREQAQHFSCAVAEFDKVHLGPGHATAYVPVELNRAAHELMTGAPRSPNESLELRDLHAVAHRALVGPGRQQGGAAYPAGLADERLAAALRRVLEASAQMRGSDGLETLLKSITQHTIDVTGAQRACVVLREPDSGLEVRKSAHADPTARRVRLKNVSNTVIHRVLESRQPVYRPFVTEDSTLLEESASIPQLGLLSILCVPILRSGKLYGVMYADSTSVGAFEPVDCEVLTLFAEQAASAIETSKLVEDVHRSFRDLKEMQDRLVRGERLRVIGELSSGVAHEFNNLLTAILARIQMMSLNYLPADARKDLDLIEKASLDAAAVVRRLQSFSRKQRQADFTLVDVAEVANDAADLLRPLWKGRSKSGAGDIHVTLEAPPGHTVRGDPTELREVFTNLIKNAVESIRGSGSVRLHLTRDKGQIHLDVSDSGCGIARASLARVFEAFYTTKGERGTGLGLSLCQQIVERHGGTLSLDSTSGEGTVVSVRLPAADHPVSRVPRPKSTRSLNQRGLRVVVVDDDPDVRGPLCTYLERLGYDVHAAADGVDGLAYALENDPDVVLTDTRMPRMGGVELCRRLHEAKPHLPIVLMSGWASDLDKAKAREVGARRVLPKPFQMAGVADVLESLVEDPA